MPAKSLAKAAQSADSRYWLFKSEEDCFSIDDLAASPGKTTFWDGVRNYQARNMLRDEVQVGDRVFFYHSNSDPLGIVGTAKVTRSGYPDHTAFDPQAQHYDPGSTEEQPRWYMVDIKLERKFPVTITRELLRDDPIAAGMEVMRKGSRLSITPVTAEQWNAVLELVEQAQ